MRKPRISFLMKDRIDHLFCFCGWKIVALACLQALSAVGETPPKLDVNDVSILWPVPRTAGDVEMLISMNEKLDDGTEIFPEKFFRQVKAHAESLVVDGKSISFPDAISTAQTWKIAGVRVNPSAFGVDPEIRKNFPEIPGIRLVVQPVTIDDQAALVHDFAAHVVFNFVNESADGSGSPEPDREAFKEVIIDLQELKRLVEEKTSTEGDLNVHPGFVHEIEDFPAAVERFVKKHLSDARFQVVSFMGLPDPQPEPWLFFSMVRNSSTGDFEGSHVKGFEEKHSGQMLDFNGGLKPSPALKDSAALSSARVSTASLFESGRINSEGNIPDSLEDQLFPDSETESMKAIKNKDVADLIANPNFRHVGNTDCVSCHTETTRRQFLGLSRSELVSYPIPEGISDVAPAVMPRDVWNVRNFGWGLKFFEGGAFVATITQRSANEAAESADFINREYLEIQSPPN